MHASPGQHCMLINAIAYGTHAHSMLSVLVQGRLPSRCLTRLRGTSRSRLQSHRRTWICHKPLHLESSPAQKFPFQHGNAVKAALSESARRAHNADRTSKDPLQLTIRSGVWSIDSKSRPFYAPERAAHCHIRPACIQRHPIPNAGFIHKSEPALSSAKQIVSSLAEVSSRVSPLMR